MPIDMPDVPNVPALPDGLESVDTDGLAGTVEGKAAWQRVAVLLATAASRGYREAELDWRLHSTATWADLIGAHAISLLAPEDDPELDDVVLDSSTAELDMVGLIAAAERVTRAHPIEVFPAGASMVVVALCDLSAGARG